MDGGVKDPSSPLFIETELEIPEFVVGKDSQGEAKHDEEVVLCSPYGAGNGENGLSDDIVKEGLYQLGFTADGVSQVYLNFALKGKDLNNVEFLKAYRHIQVLDVSENHLTDLTPIKNLPYLISLNASHNQLKAIINSNPPIGLREVNFSYNELEEIGDLSCHSLLCTLLIDNNFIEEIKGIDQCHALRNISLSHNKLSKISGLDRLPITQLDLSYNYIRKIENLHTLKNLQYINLGYNSIRSLRGLQEHELLEDINLQYNQIIDMSEIRYIRGLKLLRILNLNGNPIQEVNDYRLSVLFRIPALMELDLTPVSCEEKVAAVNLFKPSLELITAADHMENVMKSYLKPTVLLNSTLSTTIPYPMLVIIGPIGMGKKALAQRITQEFPHAFGIGVGHTTRNACTYLLNGKTKTEENGVTYHYVSKDEFEILKGKGAFLQTCTLFRNAYGITKDAIESVAAKNLACILTVELEGIMALKRSHYKPRCILVIPEDIGKYKNHLHNSNRYSESEINESIQKTNLYIDVNQMHPGYFDATIMSDSTEEIYSLLKSIIEAYLDISPPNSADSSATVDSKFQSPDGIMWHDISVSTTVSPIAQKHDKMDMNISSQAVLESYQRRYNRTKAALVGVTSSFQEQLDKIKTPISSASMPFVRGYEELIKSCTLTENGISLNSSDDEEAKLASGETETGMRLNSDSTTDTLLRYQDIDEIDLE